MPGLPPPRRASSLTEAGNFTIVGRLGDSPLGNLYEGVHRQTGDRVVIRVLSPLLSREPNLLGRLQALMRALTQAAVDTIEAPRESIRVVLREVPATHWSAGDVTIAERNANAETPGRS